MWAIVFGNPISNPQIAKKQFFGTFARTLALLSIILWLIIRNSPFGTVDKVRVSDVTIISTPVGHHMMEHLIKPDR